MGDTSNAGASPLEISHSYSRLDQHQTGENTVRADPSRLMRILKVSVVILIMAGIALSSFLYFRTKQKPMQIEAVADPAGPIPSQTPLTTGSTPPADAEDALAAQKAAEAAGQKAIAEMERQKAEEEAQQKAKDDTARDAKKHKTGKKSNTSKGTSASPSDPNPSKPKPSPLENDIYKQLQQKKIDLDVQ